MMTRSEAMALAQHNLMNLKDNPYPGRGIVAGLNEDETRFHILYWLMGRSENSRRRVLTVDGDRLRTEALDPGLVTDPSLIIYTAMDNDHTYHVVSNGAQTDAVTREPLLDHQILHGLALFRTMKGNWEYEPDKPNFTPRITAAYDAKVRELEISILRKSPFNRGCERALFSYQEFTPGIAYCVHTYQGDGNPLPAFEGDPRIVPVFGTDAEVIETYWKFLNPENRVAIALKTINVETGAWKYLIINRFPETVAVETEDEEA